MTKKTTGNVLPFKTHYSKYERRPFNCVGNSLTQQQFAEDCEIRNIMKKYDSTGFFDHINRKPEQFGDFTEVTDLAGAIDKINEAQDNFMTIPSNIRKRFNNSAQEFYIFAQDPNNFDELIDMGLATQRVSSPVEEKLEVSVPDPQTVKGTETSEPS